MVLGVAIVDRDLRVDSGWASLGPQRSGRERAEPDDASSTSTGLSEPVEIHALYPDNHPAYESYRDLLDLYRQRSDRSASTWSIPSRSLARCASSGSEFDQAGGNRAGLSVAVRGDRRLVFRGSGEADVTNALLEVGSDRPRLVGIVRGYGSSTRSPAATWDSRRRSRRCARSTTTSAGIRLSEGIPPEVTSSSRRGRTAGPRRRPRRSSTAWLSEGGRSAGTDRARRGPGLNETIGRYGLGDGRPRPGAWRGGDPGKPGVRAGDRLFPPPIVRGFQGNLPRRSPPSRRWSTSSPGIRSSSTSRSSRRRTRRWH